MIFQHTYQQILRGTKTQTRRLVAGNEVLRGDTVHVYADLPLPHSMTGRIKWQVGRTYAVQPGRGEKAVCRIRITDIRQQQLWEMDWLDAEKEGMEIDASVFDDPTDVYDAYLDAFEEYKKLWDTIHTKPGTRWIENPQVWVLDFEVAHDSAPEVS